MPDLLVIVVAIVVLAGAFAGVLVALSRNDRRH